MRTKLKRKKKSGAPRANTKNLSALADAIAQMEKWASDSVRVTLIFPEETHAVHHVGRLIKIDAIQQQFQFVSNSGMLVWLMAKSWTNVEREIVPQFVNTIHVTNAGLRRRVMLTLTESDLMGQASRRRLRFIANNLVKYSGGVCGHPQLSPVESLSEPEQKPCAEKKKAIPGFTG